MGRKGSRLSSQVRWRPGPRLACQCNSDLAWCGLVLGAFLAREEHSPGDFLKTRLCDVGVRCDRRHHRPGEASNRTHVNLRTKLWVDATKHPRHNWMILGVSRMPWEIPAVICSVMGWTGARAIIWLLQLRTRLRSAGCFARTTLRNFMIW